MKTLSDLVNEYNSLKVQDFNNQRKHYENIKDLSVAINHACFGLYGVDGNLFFCDHFENVFNGEKLIWMYAVRDKLLSMEEQLQGMEGSTFNTFYRIMKGLIFKMDGIGPLLLYDISLRIGWYLQVKGPVDLYAQRGSRWGLESFYKLDHDSLKDQEPIIESFSKFIAQNPVFAQLNEASHLENFLCIYRKDLRKIK